MALMKSSNFNEKKREVGHWRNLGRGSQSISTRIITSYNGKFSCISEILKTLLNKMAHL